MLERFRWAVLALAQEPEVQKELFPDFVGVADELALTWEFGLEAVEPHERSRFNEVQNNKIAELDRQIAAISGPANLEFWDDVALSERGEWARIRLAAADVASAFGWPLTPPPQPSPDFYIDTSGGRNS